MKRRWKNYEINVFVHIFQYDKGVLFLYVNYSNIVYEENLLFELCIHNKF
jgi:hypothetical protein